MGIEDVPTLNAALNATSAALLVWGHRLVKKRRFQMHKRVMLSALAVSALFLISYVVYHAQVGSVRFQKIGPIRAVYFSVLISHTVLAVLIPPLAISTVYRAWKGQFERHRRLARVTLPFWLYVSVTGVIVYLMLYRL